MAVNSLYPASVRIAISNVMGVHYQIHPTRAWVGTPFTTPGEYVAWDETTIAADVMIEDMIDDMLPLLAAESTVTGYEIFTYASPTSDATPVFIKSLTGKVGTSVATGWFKALQRTYTLLTEFGGLARKVILDEPASNDFDPVFSLGVTADATWINHFLSTGEAWNGRDGGRLVAFRSLKFDLNDKLKRNYGM